MFVRSKHSPTHLGTLATATTLAVLISSWAAPSAHAASVAQPANASFEVGLASWKTTGTPASAKLESGGHASNTRLTHWNSATYTAQTVQAVALAKGQYTLAVWVQAGGPQPAASSVGVRGCGPAASRAVPTTVQDGQWLRLAVPFQVNGAAACQIVLGTSGPGASWASFDDVSIIAGASAERQVRGADLSSVPKNEAFGAAYLDASGARQAPERILADAGANLGRLKVFVNPADGFNDQAHVVAMAKRLKAAGMKVLIDFHYSDTWADPGKQTLPSAWQGLTPAQLTTKVYEHTSSVLTALDAAGVPADYVQIGNEINPGLLWPWGQTWDVNPSDGVSGAQWENLADFLKAGIKAVHDTTPAAKTILHLTNLNNGIGGLTWWYDEVTAHGVGFDIIGLSYYGYWHGGLGGLQTAVSTLSARYDKDVLVVETAYPWTLADNPTVPWENTIDSPDELVPGYPATVQSQRAWFDAVQDVVVSAPGGRGLGAVYWEPAWTAVAGNGWDPADPTSGNAWENQATFDFTGRVLGSVAAFGAEDRP